MISVIYADGYCVQWGFTPSNAITAHANTVESYYESFDKVFTSISNIEITLMSGSSSAEDMSKIHHAANGLSTTGFEIRIFCGPLSANRLPRYYWIATGYVN